MAEMGSFRTIRRPTLEETRMRDARDQAISEYRSRKKLKAALRRAERLARSVQLNPADCQNTITEFHYLDFVSVWNSPLVQQAIGGLAIEYQQRLRELLLGTMKGLLPANIWRKAISDLIEQKKLL